MASSRTWCAATSRPCRIVFAPSCRCLRCRFSINCSPELREDEGSRILPTSLVAWMNSHENARLTAKGRAHLIERLPCRDLTRQPGCGRDLIRIPKQESANASRIVVAHRDGSFEETPGGRRLFGNGSVASARFFISLRSQQRSSWICNRPRRNPHQTRVAADFNHFIGQPFVIFPSLKAD
jgi:hypothetical protein